MGRGPSTCLDAGLLVQEAAGTQSNAAEVPDFEREFFQENSDDESESASSDSSGDQSEEEAKHF